MNRTDASIWEDYDNDSEATSLMFKSCKNCERLWRIFAAATAAYLQAVKERASASKVDSLLAERQKAQEAVRQHEVLAHLKAPVVQSH
jgi:hypothetical protein